MTLKGGRKGRNIVVFEAKNIQLEKMYISLVPMHKNRGCASSNPEIKAENAR